MLNHGELIQTLREDRQITQAQLARGVMPRSTLASFEQNNQKIYWQHLAKFLDKMNVSFEEYSYLLFEGELNEKKKTSLQMAEVFHQDYHEEYAESLLEKYHESGDFYYYGLFAQYVLHADFAGEKVSFEIEEIKNRLTRYLTRIYPWGRFELLLFSGCLFVFDDQTIFFHLSESIQQMRLYQESANYSHDLLRFLINGANLANRRKNQQNLLQFIKELQQIAEHSLEAKLFCRLFELLYHYNKGVENPIEREQLRQTLTFLGAEAWVTYLEKNYPG